MQAYIGLFEVVVRMNRVVRGWFRGNKSAIESSSSAALEVAGKGRHRVGGRERPGKVSTSTLTIGSMTSVSGRR